MMKYFNADIVPKYNDEELLHWLINEAGVSHTAFFGKLRGNLELQQIPYEYVNLLQFFKKRDIKTYLELGVANGGSFLTNSVFIGSGCETFHAVDCLAYAGAIGQTAEVIEEKIDNLKMVMPNSECKFFNSTTDKFFENLTDSYDCIFIDADHTYDGVKKDYLNSLKHVDENGVLIFHDIGNDTRTGVARLWNEIKSTASSIEEYLWKPQHVKNYTCGIGIYIV